MGNRSCWAEGSIQAAGVTSQAGRYEKRRGTARQPWRRAPLWRSAAVESLTLPFRACSTWLESLTVDSASMFYPLLAGWEASSSQALYVC